MADTGVMMFILCAVMYPSHVATVDHEYIFYIEGNHPEQNVTVAVREDVTLVCINTWNDHRVIWYRNEATYYVAFIDYNGGECTLTTNTGYSWIKKSGHNCTGYNYGITLPNIQKSDGGKWVCELTKGNYIAYSNTVNIQVTDKLTTPTTITKVSTTSIDLSSTTPKTATSATSPETQGFNASVPNTNVGVTESNVKETDNRITLIAAAFGGTVGLIIIVNIVIITVRKRKASTVGGNRTDYIRGQHDGHSDLEDDTGGHYAQIADATGEADNRGVHIQPPPHGTSSTVGEARGQGASLGGHYSVLHAESQDYQHMYGVMAGYATRPQSEANREYYNFHPAQHDNVHMYTTADEEPCTSSV